MDSWKEDAVVYAAAEITVVKCDPIKELVWVGDAEGRVSSYYGQHLLPYVSFFAHDGPVKDMQFTTKFVSTSGSDGVAAHHRNGISADRNEKGAGDALVLSHENGTFLVGYERKLKRFQSTPRIQETGFFEIDCIPEDVHLTRLIAATPYVAVGMSDGSVQVLETFTFDPVLPKPIVPHSGELTDLDSRKNIIVTCGVAQRRYGPMPDVFVSCYDTRALKTSPPFSVGTGASFVRLHPKAPNHAVVVGLSGQITFLDSKDPTSISIKQAIVQSPVVGIDISPLGVAVVIAERSYIHLWSTNQTRPIESETFAGLDVPNSLPPLPVVSDDVPSSRIGVSAYRSVPFNLWDPSIIFETGMPTPDWEKVKNPYILQGHSSVKPKHSRYRRSSSVSVPRFLSEKARQRGIGDDEHSTFVDVIRSDDSASRGKVPKLWRQMFIHYSKFGVDDFDFTFYNHTNFAGLEPLSASKYCNAVLQLYRWCPGVYNPVLATFAKYNWKALKTTGELAIVMDMLAKANGYHCRATNFMDILQLQMRCTELHKVLMRMLFDEYSSEIGGECELSSTMSNLSIKTGDMRSALKESIKTSKRKTPYVFVTVESNAEDVTTADENEKELRNFVKSFGIAEQNVPGKDEVQYAYDFTSQEYRLHGYVAEVSYGEERHTVAVINIEGRWYSFNDFLVTPISTEDALDFTKPWKKICISMYGSNIMGPATLSPETFDMSWKDQIDIRLLRERRIISGNLNDPGLPTEMLQSGEEPPSLVALDAEFVLLRREIAELHSDGSKVSFSPKKLSLARISVVRENEDVLIDDRIESKHDIVDFLTAFSGVEPDDLDPEKSKFGSVAHQTATRRLWILSNSGTKFVGHALINDFRAINLYVPPDQVSDTFEIFYDRDRNGFRRLSLKFLMWAVLGEKVQTGNHDSVQDAQSALKLYRKYQESKSAGELDNMLANVAIIGQRYNYKVPLSSNGSSYGSSSVPNSAGSVMDSPLL